MSAASAQTVVDGDTLQLKGTTYRLYGIDAPDDGQVCPDGWPAAWEAESYLSQLIGGRTVTCTTIGLPKKDEAEAICRADGVDLGAAMVTGGMAYAFVPHSARYITQEEAAAKANRGVHRHKCLTPWDGALTWANRTSYPPPSFVAAIGDHIVAKLLPQPPTLKSASERSPSPAAG